jgi:histidyl-tRNA synthetase
VTRIRNHISELKNCRKQAQETIDTIHAKFEKMGIKKESDIERKEREILDEIKLYSDKLEKIEKNRDQYVAEARRQIAAEGTEARPLEELTKENVQSILSDLRPMNAVRTEIETERGIKKSMRLFFRKRWAA